MPSRRPHFSVSLRTFLVGLSLVVLTLPIAGIQVMRIYESALVRQTESALIAQAAFIASMYRAAIIEQGTQDWSGLSRAVVIDTENQGTGWVPRPPELDLATSPILPPFPDGLADAQPHPYAAAVGGRLHPVLKDAQLTTLAGIRVVDPWGIIIATTGEDLGQDISHGQEINTALRGQNISLIRRKEDIVETLPADNLSRASKVRVFVASPIILHDRLVGAVMLSRTPPSIVQALYAKRWLFFQGAIYLLAIALSMALITYRLMARPISRLAHQAQQISLGEGRGMAAINRHHKPRLKEVAKLQDAIVEMSTTLEQRANYLQDFARHISHEFKTPLASIRGAIEVLGDHRTAMSEEQYQTFVNNITADAQRLQRLTERLNELARADLGQTQPCTHLLTTLFNNLAYDENQIDLVIDDSVEGQEQILDAPSFCAALEVLIENAAQNKATQVTIALNQQQNLIIRDNGSGISQGNAEKIFEPFFTTRRETGGTGLGLPIAQALLSRSQKVLKLVQLRQPTTFEILSEPFVLDSSIPPE